MCWTGRISTDRTGGTVPTPGEASYASRRRLVSNTADQQRKKNGGASRVVCLAVSGSGLLGLCVRSLYAPRRMNHNDIHCLLPLDPTITGSVWRTRGSKQAVTRMSGMNASEWMHATNTLLSPSHEYEWVQLFPPDNNYWLPSTTHLATVTSLCQQ